jgi:hypothetical protein
MGNVKNGDAKMISKSSIYKKANLFGDYVSSKQYLFEFNYIYLINKSNFVSFVLYKHKGSVGIVWNFT